MAFNVAKVLSVKTICREINPSVLVFYARLAPALLLIAPAYYANATLLDARLFFGATAAAAFLTIIASVLYLRSMQTGDLALVSPIQASVPVFMILTTCILYGEKPGAAALFFILAIAGSVGYVLVKSARSSRNRASQDIFLPVVMSFAASALYGVSTVIDRIAIAATVNGAMLYSLCWNLMTVLLLTPYLVKSRDTLINEARNRPSGIIVYALFVTFAFVLQQLAVQESLHIDNGVTYVKAIVMLHIGIAATLGITLFKEKVGLDLLVSNAVALFCGIALIAIA